MLNIFPIAENSVIEQTIGYQRPSAHPPKNQTHMPPNLPYRCAEFVPFRGSPRWFNPDTVSSYEGLLFQEADYLRIRNAILDIYRNGHGQISLGMCSSLGPFSLVLRIFDFLEDNHLINFEVNLKAELTALQKKVSGTGTPDQRPDAQDADLDFSSPLLISHHGERANTNAQGCINKRRVKKRYISLDQLENSKCACGTPASKFTSDMYFACDTCFSEQRYPPRYTSRNFHDITPRLLQSLWTKKDEYLLLKSIEQHGDSWTNIAQSLGKSTQQCIFHFLKMSLLDECTAFPAICFGTVPNQITTFIAYVSYIVSPAISPELAKAAIKYIETPEVMDILIGLAVRKAQAVLDIERAKLARLQKVCTEALIRKISLKIEAYRGMCSEIAAVRSELEVEREKLVSELIKN